MSQVDEALALIANNAVEFIGAEGLRKKLESGAKLRVKAGFDPTRPDLHLGHWVLLRKLRQFQELGHEVIFIVGDFTAQIGDPSGRNATRPVPSEEEIREGAKSYAEQAFRVLDPQATRVVYNSEWLAPMGFAQVIRLAGKYTLARLMEREDFRTRWANHVPIALHELLYPLVQGYDSVHLKADIELGGSDQLFNLLVGRELMKEFGLSPQAVLTTPILEGLSAREEGGVLVGDKMSKSLGNHVAFNDSPSEQWGKIMSIADPVMWRYFTLLSRRPASEIAEWKAAAQSGSANPRDLKMALAEEIVTFFHGAEAAQAAREAWNAQFSRKEVPAEMPECHVQSEGETLWVPKALVLAGLVPSSTEARRRIEQGSVEVDGERLSDPKATFERGRRYVVRAGKRAWATILVD